MKKRILSFLAAIALFTPGAVADEGMWMLPLLQKMNGKAIAQAGCRLTPEQIYSINNSSLKDAIVQFGGGCTGEIISGEGLLVTNHHCGYGSIQKLSSVEHDYLKDGYWAMNRSEELPCEGLTVTFLEYMQDVTAVIEKARKKAQKEFKGQENEEELIAEAMQKEYDRLIEEAEKNNPYCEANIVPYYDNNVYYLIVDKVYNDVRFVGAPPSSIGKFGADTDNWMWPRHTGDFSMFRVYADKDNNPAAYSPDNVPYTPKRSLKISLKGIKEGDYTMIMGYPGHTTRFQTSPELKFQIEQNDIRIAARTIRQDLMMEDMLADPKVKIQYASKYSGSSNGWKKWQGMKLAFDKLNIIGRAENDETEFTEWVSANKKRTEQYGQAMEAIKEAVEGQSNAYSVYTTLVESAARMELASAASLFYRTFSKADQTDTLKALQAAAESLNAFYKDYSAGTDRKISKAMLKFYRENVAPEYYLGLGEDFAALDIDKYVDDLFDNSAFTSPAKLSAAISEYGTGILDDPAFLFGKSISGVAAKVFPVIMQYQEQLSKGRKAYTAGLLEWRKGEPSYPDANFTMRMTYGSVKPYSPKDAVIYRYYTTLDGVMEKEDPDNWEFVVPAKLKELWKAQDFGEYAMADGKMPLAFLSNNDITGGNSGSPIMNADGELIGLAFDGNWESMSSDVMFEPDLQRCINVDIRYVLFIVDKFGGAGYLIDEMDIVK
ncbi:MAG: S46 family peptidase [Bacteroidales bacterium]|nr:S46 family peptidase [Bacteroidales bacterium]MDE6148312.1 S46 family peptidase [Bacteroidales bacterium]